MYVSSSRDEAGPAAARGVVWVVLSLGLATALLVAAPRWIVQLAQQGWVDAVGRESYVTGAQAASLTAQTQVVTLWVVVPATMVATLVAALGGRRGVTWLKRAGRAMATAWRTALQQEPSARTRSLEERPRRERIAPAALAVVSALAVVAFAGWLLFLTGRYVIGMVGERFVRAEIGPGTAIALWTFLAAMAAFFIAAAIAEYAPGQLARAQHWARAVAS